MCLDKLNKIDEYEDFVKKIKKILIHLKEKL